MDSYALYHAARADRSRRVGDLIASALVTVVATVRRIIARYRQRQRSRATSDALRSLDDRMLRDLGFDRSEIVSVAFEVTGLADRSRVRALLMSRGMSR